MPPGPAALSARYHQAFNDRDFDVWRAVLDEDVELVVDGRTFHGVDAAVAYGVDSVTRFPGLSIDSERVVAESGDTVVTEIRLVDGDPARGPGTACEVSRMRDGRIASCRRYHLGETGRSEDPVGVPARGEAARIAEEQAALRRVAMLVARGAPPAETFEAVIGEICRLLPADAGTLGRYERDDTLVIIGFWSRSGEDQVPSGGRHAIERGNLAQLVLGSGRPARIDSYAQAAGSLGETARHAGARSSVGAPVIVGGRVWGLVAVASTTDLALPSDTEDRVAAFTELLATAIANAQSREDLTRLAEEQAALRRVATLVAEGVEPERLFLAVTEEVGKLLDADLAGMIRYGSDDTLTPVATWAAEGEHPAVDGPWTLDGDRLATAIATESRPAREDDWAAVGGPIAAFVREQLGIRSSVGSPIVVQGRVWGALFVHSTTDEPLPRHTELRLGNFTELVGTAIANTQARAEADRLAEEQAALRRVATLVARGVPQAELFEAVTEEVGGLHRADFAGMIRYESDTTVTPVAAWAAAGPHPELPPRWPTEPGDPATLIAETRRAARISDWTAVPGPIAAFIREELRINTSVGAPILVEGRLWGALAIHSQHARPLPVDTESRLENFTELVATAISNMQARSDLAASRARIVAAADHERRRVVRDLHDGAQQRLVHTVITLKLANDALRRAREGAAELVREALDHAEHATTELRELSHGILPAALTQGGLRAGVEALRSRMPIPVENRVSVERLPAAIEATAYFVVAESLTNVAKHARARGAAVIARVESGRLRVQVRDDGIGGALPDGNGLVGLADRVAVFDGSLRVESPVGGGTMVTADFPLPEDGHRASAGDASAPHSSSATSETGRLQQISARPASGGSSGSGR